MKWRRGNKLVSGDTWEILVVLVDFIALALVFFKAKVMRGQLKFRANYH
jgi:hypothetical protein